MSVTTALPGRVRRLNALNAEAAELSEAVHEHIDSHPDAIRLGEALREALDQLDEALGDTFDIDTATPSSLSNRISTLESVLREALLRLKRADADCEHSGAFGGALPDEVTNLVADIEGLFEDLDEDSDLDGTDD